MEANSVMMTEFEALKRISAYIAENKQQSALQAEVKNMVVEANKEFHQKGLRNDFDPKPPDKFQEKIKARGSTLSIMKSLWDSRRIH